MKIKIHYTFYLMIIMMYFLKMLPNFLIILGILFVHEMGHLFFLKKYKYKINSIHIFPIGAFIKYEEEKNTSNKVDFLISSAGIIMNIIIHIIFKIFKVPQDIINLNLVVLVFNLLPIYPLDGNRILTSISSCFFRYYSVMIISFAISIITIFLTFIFYNISFNISMLLILFPLLYENIIYFRKRRIMYNQFLLDKYLYPKGHNKRYLGDKYPLYNYFYKGKNNCYFKNDYHLNEKDILKKKFKSIDA